LAEPDALLPSTIAELADKMREIDPPAMATVEKRRKLIFIRSAPFYVVREAFPAGPDKSR
jgi:hypothetical protein